MASHPDFEFEKSLDLENQTSGGKKVNTHVEERPVERSPSPATVPTNRRELKKDWISRWIDRAFDVVCVLVAILFLVFGIIAMNLEHDLVDETVYGFDYDFSIPYYKDFPISLTFSKDGVIFDVVTKRLPTVLPIVFAVLVGGTVKAWAHLEIERGTTLGVSHTAVLSSSLILIVYRPLNSCKALCLSEAWPKRRGRCAESTCIPSYWPAHGHSALLDRRAH